METKLCKKCNLEKNIDNFRTKKVKGKFYIYSYCRKCERDINKNYIINHNEKRKEYMKKYRIDNKEKIENKRKEYRKNNIEKVRIWNNKSYKKNKEKIKISQKKYRTKNKEKINNYIKNKKKKDYIYKLKCQIRSNILNAFKSKGFKKSSKTKKILGCDYETFINHLLNTFKNNYGYEWDGKEPVHIDHIKPLKQCNTEEEVIKCCYYTNLQLLKAKDNLRKSSKSDWELH